MWFHLFGLNWSKVGKKTSKCGSKINRPWCHLIPHCVILQWQHCQQVLEVKHKRWGVGETEERGPPSKREGHLLGLGKKDGGVGRRNKQVCVHSAHMTTVWESQRFQHAVQWWIRVKANLVCFYAATPHFQPEYECLGEYRSTCKW